MKKRRPLAELAAHAGPSAVGLDDELDIAQPDPEALTS